MQASQKGKSSTKGSSRKKGFKSKSPKATGSSVGDGTKKGPWWETHEFCRTRTKNLNTLFVAEKSVPAYSIPNQPGCHPHFAANQHQRFVPLVKEVERKWSYADREPFHVAASLSMYGGSLKTKHTPRRGGPLAEKDIADSWNAIPPRRVDAKVKPSEDALQHKMAPCDYTTYSIFPEPKPLPGKKFVAT
eukprot:gnl/MRDRNA2_/MRDRNA2_136963_c0_seq1.p1 gnl/MRDRNA2_/MRDRNA2_136963_c0~~gnl/MRDRNA2_/MRDRNA2_136963_c0_seq1.p1  ORF type:complete len:190 (-),score=32.39 gnl/MRDRNA2_/MRDRNA2_136963_c0_seq1:20-589(-)